MIGAMHGVVRSAAVVVAASVAALVLPAAGASAQTAYPAKTITIVLGTGAGGGYAVASQLLSRYWPAHIPGHPTIIVQAMPGGGGLKMAGWLHHVAPHDGSVVGMPAQTVALEQVLQPKSAKYDVHSWPWIGSMATMHQSVVINASAPVHSFADARKHQLVIGATGRAGNLFFTPKLAKELAGAKFKIVLGYRGSADMDKAMELNEIQGRGGAWDDWKLRYPDWKTANRIRPLVLTGMTPDPEAPNVPLLRNLVGDPIDQQAVDLFGFTDDMARTYAAVPKTPQHIVDMLRTSFEATMKDKQLASDARARGVPFSPADWHAVEKSVLATVNMSPKVVHHLSAVLAK